MQPICTNLERPIDERRPFVREKQKDKEKQRANVWGKNKKIVLYNIYDIFILPSVCKREDDIVEDRSIKKGVRRGRRVFRKEYRATNLPVGCLRALTSTE
jgi:hypothetical protein